MPDCVTARPHFNDSLVPPRGSQVPEELLAIIPQHLANSRFGWGFDWSLAQCSLTCRYWAAHIRPVIFRRVTLRSEKMVRAFTALFRSPIAVPGPLGGSVRYLEIKIDNTGRPWLFHVWALLRDGMLPNIERIDMSIDGANSQDSRRNDALLDIGLPRRLPSARPIQLDNLTLHNLQFSSYKALVRNLRLHFPKYIFCEEVQWLGGSRAGHLHPRLSLDGLEKVTVKKCTAVFPFIQSAVVTHTPSPGAVRRGLQIGEGQIDAAMDILRLFSDECTCGKCVDLGKGWWYELKVYPGMYWLTSDN